MILSGHWIEIWLMTWFWFVLAYMLVRLRHG